MAQHLHAGRPADEGVGGRARPLVVTRDEELLDELLRVANAAGVEVSVAVDSLAAEDGWASAPLVIVGADRVAEMARRGLPRRLGVVIVAGPHHSGDAAPWREAEVLHAEHVVDLPDGRAWLVARFSEYGLGARLARRARTLAVVDGSDGAAASEVALALAAAAGRKGRSALLISGAPLAPEPRCAGVPLAGGTDGGSLAVVALERHCHLGIPPESMAAALRAGRAGRDLIVVDLPYGLDEASSLALTCADRGLLVVVAQIRSCAAATRVAAVARRHCPDLGLVVRSGGRGGLRPAEVAQALDLPLLAVLPAEPALLGRADQPADPGGVLARLCARLLSDVDVAATSALPGTPDRGQP